MILRSDPCAGAASRGPAPASHAAGFSLIELMIALTILALAVSLVSVNLAGRSPGLELRRASTEITGLMRDARLSASERGVPVIVRFSPETRQFSLDDGAVFILPPGTEADLVSSARLGQPGIQFWPQGGSTGGIITLRTGTLEEEIRVDWLTARVERQRVK